MVERNNLHSIKRKSQTSRKTATANLRRTSLARLALVFCWPWMVFFNVLTQAQAQGLSGAFPNFPDIFSRGQTELLLSGYAWHDPNTYSRLSLQRDNSLAWGGGLAKSLDRSDGVSELVFGLVFSDSERQAEYTIGYSRTWNAKIFDQLRIGAGFAVGLTERPDIFSGAPTPFVLPTLTARLFDRVDIYVTYIPPLPKDVNVKGDVALIFAGIRF